jgi:hypothetical protein
MYSETTPHAGLPIGQLPPHGAVDPGHEKRKTSSAATGGVPGPMNAARIIVQDTIEIMMLIVPRMTYSFLFER